ncbi:MAG: hypothetical protein EB127_08475 [Alphaproteobacteria bacterium]|nr:hypothetical protein [Alphaproteobacteria bacterium]
MLDKLKGLFKKKKIAEVAQDQVRSAKDIANEKGEPYFAILNMDIDPSNINAGSFEFDWNDKMIADLVRHGYMMSPKDTDADIIDRWFTAVCRNVVLETAEQYEAMTSRVVKSRDVGDGRSEVS